MTETLTIPRLILVTDRLRASGPIVDVVRSSVEGGVQAVQIREKDLPVAQLNMLARDIRIAVQDQVPVLINGCPEIASGLGIGLHLPESFEFSQSDRSRLAPGVLIGRAVHSPESASLSEWADYVIAGHVYETSSKAGLPVLGVAALAMIVKAAPCPVLAIGGITPERVPEVMESGVHGIAVMSGICASADPLGRAREYLKALNGESMTDTTDSAGASIAVQVNGKPAELRPGTTIEAFLELKGLHQNMVVVEHNGQILKKGQFADREIIDGDELEVVHFVGGG